MTLDRIELMSEADRLAYASRLAGELLLPVPDYVPQRYSAPPASSPVVQLPPQAFVALGRQPQPIRHGTGAGYDAGCLCHPCERADKDRARRRRTRANARRAPAPIVRLVRAGGQ